MSIAGAGFVRSDSPDSREFSGTCARIDSMAHELRRMGIGTATPFLGVKTYNGKPKKDPGENRFAGMIQYPKCSTRTSGPGLIHIRPPPRPVDPMQPRKMSMSKFKSRGRGRS